MMFRYSEADVRKVRKVQFGILGPEELKTASVCEITTSQTFENGKAIPGGLMDSALGAIDRNMPCSTCGMDEQECPGHFGHLCLTKPMYHVSFINTTLKVLRCVCFSCSVILGDDPPVDGQQSDSRLKNATSKKNPVRRLRAVMDLAKTKTTCWSCSSPQPNFKRDGLMINAEFKEATDVRRQPLPHANTHGGMRRCCRRWLCCCCSCRAVAARMQEGSEAACGAAASALAAVACSVWLHLARLPPACGAARL